MNNSCSVSAIVIGCVLVAIGCSGSSSTGANQPSASGGGAAASASNGKGGSSSATGSQALGGYSAVAGGAESTGGHESTGGTTGATAGGKSAVGGTSSIGGTEAVGGAAAGGVATAGKSSNGGTAATGGSSGGKSNTGGVGGTSSTGGRPSAGGSSATVGGNTSSGGGTGPIAKPNFDWVGVVGSGQSLSVGFTPINTKLGLPDGKNKMLQLGATNFPGTATGTGGNPGVPVPGTPDKPWDSTMSDLKVVDLVEPLRAESSGYPRPYPINLWGETHHGAMALQLTNFEPDYVTVHTVVGESGKGITALVKQTGTDIGDTGRAYAATIFEAGAISRIAKTQGKTYGVGVVVMTHGETDADPPNAQYKDQLIQLMVDYNKDIAAATGQTYKIPMYINQQHAYPNGASSKGKRPEVNNMQWQLGADHKDDFVCTGPKYQYEANPNGDGVHLSVTGAEMLGEKTAQVFHERAVLGNDWQPLMPSGVEITSARVVTVHFHVPVPPLNWDTSFADPAITEWKNGKGFELRSDTANITIASVAISGNDVQITASTDLPTSGLHVGYAISSQGKQLTNHSKAVRWGQLRDSDPFKGIVTQQANPNYCVSFDIPVQ